MSRHLVDSLATTDALSTVFADAAMMQAMLDFESALAAAQAELGVIPRAAADAIVTSARAGHFDPERIGREARAHATVAIPLVGALRAHVRAVDADAARFVHWGATSQDVSDSALVLTIARARPFLAADERRLDAALTNLSNAHAGSVMLARTLLQPASPTTFGLKAAHWTAAVRRGWARVEREFDAACVVQLGGAAGTLAAMADRGPAVAEGVARRLALTMPAAPWHTNRDGLAGLICALGVFTGTLGKIARDLSLLMQDEIGEAAEPGGGSSTLPHKRNPAGAAVAIAAATRMPSLVSAYLSAMVQEHERAAGGWQSEWPTVAAVVQAAGAALAALGAAVEGLTVDPARMRANIERTGGAVFAERVVVLAAPRIGRDAAEALVRDALDAARASGQTFTQALAASPRAAAVLSADELSTIDDPEAYLGAAEALRLRLIS
jgi:3-carboxy-cis,cis-muconate cycloisomerase